LMPDTPEIVIALGVEQRLTARDGAANLFAVAVVMAVAVAAVRNPRRGRTCRTGYPTGVTWRWSPFSEVVVMPMCNSWAIIGLGPAAGAVVGEPAGLVAMTAAGEREPRSRRSTRAGRR